MEGGNLGIGPIGKFIPAGWGMAAKPCDTCKSAAALLFCRVDSVFLCIGCDAKVHHGLGHMQAHARVWMCEVCEHAPASVTCKADAAALCVSCDRDIHSANPLARRHERIPVVPFYDTAEAVVKSAAAAAGDPFLVPAGDETTEITNNCSHTCFAADDETTVTPASWVFPNPHAKLAGESPDVKAVEFLLSDSDQFLDFDYPVTDSVVPVQPMKSFEATAQQMMNQSSNKCLEIDFTSSKLNLFNINHCYTAQSFSQSISSSSMDVGVVPDGSFMSEISYGRTCSGTVDPTGSINTTPSQGSDREARVLRYREKRKNRKFEKTIRYASRKAYAETRPRIKGRFAKRSETEPVIMNRMFNSGSSAFMSEAAGYGVVPSF